MDKIIIAKELVKVAKRLVGNRERKADSGDVTAFFNVSDFFADENDLRKPLTHEQVNMGMDLIREVVLDNHGSLHETVSDGLDTPAYRNKASKAGLLLKKAGMSLRRNFRT